MFNTKFKFLIITCIFLIPFFCYGQEKSAFKIFNKAGKEIKYSDAVHAMLGNDVIFFGEIHNNPVAHWLELQVLKDLHNAFPSIQVGMEMLETDNQIIIDEYFKKFMQEKNFTAEARLWTNYETDYKPLVEYCYSNSIHLIATNIPRRYANMVYWKGTKILDSLSSTSKGYMAPLPFPINLALPGYKALNEGNHHSDSIASNLALSQAIKDATMAYFITKNLDKKLLHFNGSYHSHNFEGICWYLKEFKKDVRLFTIETVEQSSIENIEVVNKGIADIVVVIPSDMTKTY